MQTPIILYDNILSQGYTLTATDTEEGYDVLNIIDWRPYTFWKAASIGTKYITVDSGSGLDPLYADSLAIYNHNFAGRVYISVESSDDGSSWTTRLNSFTPTYNRAFLKTFTLASAQFWRIKLIATSEAPYMAIAVLGQKLQFPYPPDTPYIPYSEVPVADVERSKNGHILGVSTYLPALKMRVQFSNITRTWFDTYFLPFWQNHGRLYKPFFFAWDLDTYKNDVFLVSIDDEYNLESPFSVLTYIDILNLNMRGIREI